MEPDIFEDEPVRETLLFGDDAKLICDLIKEQWSLGPQNMPTVEYEPESMMMDSRIGSIFVQKLTRSNTINTVDYRTLMRTSTLSIKLSARNRATYYEFGQELYRILLANRRPGYRKLGGYNYLELLSEREVPNLSGWYTMNMDIRLVAQNVPIRSAGFGDNINKRIEESEEEVHI